MDLKERFKRLYTRDILLSEGGSMSKALLLVFDRLLLEEYGGDQEKMSETIQETIQDFEGPLANDGSDPNPTIGTDEELRNEVNRLSAILEKHGLE